MVPVRILLFISVSFLAIAAIPRGTGEHVTQGRETCQASSVVQDCRVDITLHGKNKGVRIEFDLETGKGRLTDNTSGKVTPFEVSERSAAGREMLGRLSR